MEEAPQVTSLNILHGDELDALRLPEIKDADDVAMSNFTREDEFLFEAAEDFGMARKIRANELERDEALEFDVTSFLNSSHSSLA
jgi:hypothetical protein